MARGNLASLYNRVPAQQRVGARLRGQQVQQLQKQAGGQTGFMQTAARSNATAVARRMGGVQQVPLPASMTGGLSGGGGLGSYGSDYDEARAANEARYKEILAGYGQRTADVMGQLEGYGDQRGQDISRAYSNLSARGNQDLISRGLTASTIKPTMEAGFLRREQAEQRRLGEDLTRMRVDTGARLEGDRLGFMERKNEPYPDLGAYTQAALAMGQSGMGSVPYGSQVYNPTLGAYGMQPANLVNRGPQARQPQPQQQMPVWLQEWLKRQENRP